MSVYVDSSAAAKLVVDEDETSALGEYLDARSSDGDLVYSSWLTETELLRLTTRKSLPASLVSQALQRMSILGLSREVYLEAGTLAADDLRSLDALHIALALQVQADRFVTYDKRQAASAEIFGFNVVAP